MRKLIIAALVAAVIPAVAQAQSCQSIAQSVLTGAFNGTFSAQMLAGATSACETGVSMRASGKSANDAIAMANMAMVINNKSSNDAPNYLLGTAAGALAMMEGYAGGDK